MKSFLRNILFVLLGLQVTSCSSDDSFMITAETEQIMERAVIVQEAIDSLFLEAEKAEELIPQVARIKEMEGVENAWIEDVAFCVRMKNGGLLTWLFDDEESENDAGEYMARIDSTLFDKSVTRSGSTTNNDYCENQKVCIINQQANDLSRNRYKQYYDDFANRLKTDWSKEVTRVNAHLFNLEFLQTEINQYGLIFLVSHGAFFDDCHWIATGESDFMEAYLRTRYGMDSQRYKQYSQMYQYWSNDELCIAHIKEKRSTLSEEKNVISYVAFSEWFVEHRIGQFPDNSILFCTACQSLKGNEGLGKAFQRKNLGCYLGYTDDNSVGKYAGPIFFETLLLSKATVATVFQFIASNMKIDNEAVLKSYPENSNICLYEAEEQPTDAEAVDLGLSVKWASRNFGASTPTEKGRIFVTNEDFNPRTMYVKCPDLFQYIDYQTEIAEISNTELDPVKQTMGNGWRMPTEVEMRELINNCTWEPVVLDDIPGFKVTGSTNQSIFLPATDFTVSGYQGVAYVYAFSGNYLTGTYNNHMVDMYFSHVIGSVPSNQNPTIQIYDYDTLEGAIRPVR